MNEQVQAVQRMQDYLEEHVEDEVTLEDLAAVSLFSPWHSYRLFRRLTGMTPADYQRRMRLTHSAARLREEGRRVALVAKNGTGKTTLLNIIAGKESHDAGSVVPRRGLRIAYLEQSPAYPAGMTVLEACFHSESPALKAIAEYERAIGDASGEGLQEAMARMDALEAWDYEQRAKRILSRLKIRDFGQKVETLSGGQLKRVALANVLISESDLTGIERPDSGVIDIGETVRFGYYSQQGLEFDDSMRVIDVVTAIAEQVELGDGRRMSASQLLQHFLFTPETQYNYVARLSGGERRRLYLCTVLMQSPNFLVLDEPTNDLDIVTLGILEEYLQAFRGCVIVVSHDRYFVDKVADHLLVFCGGGEIRDFAGTYSEYVAWKREYEAARRAEAAQARPKPQAAKTQAAEAVPRKLSFNEKRELEALETEIPALEAEKAALEASLSSGTLPVEELTAQSRRIAELIASIDEKTMRWLELSER